MAYCTAWFTKSILEQLRTSCAAILFQNVIAYIMQIYLHVLQHMRTVTSSQPVAVPRSVPQSCIIRNNSLCTKAWTLFENSFVPPNKIVPKGKPTAPKICCAICSNEVEKDQVAMCVECKKNKFDVCTEIEAHLILHPPFLPIRFSYKYGGAYNLIMVISLVYTPPFSAVEHARETAMAEWSVTISCSLR